MDSSQDYALQSSNTFNIKAQCADIYFPSTLAELNQLPSLVSQAFYILGEGSNTLFVEQQAPVIIQPKFLGMAVSEYDDHYIVRVGAAENWHALVCFCVAKGINGLENLALIPGSVGAAPIQNIGAYGVDFSDYCQTVIWYEFASQTMHTLSKQACDFAYRDSIFKKSLYNQGLITEVIFKFPKAWQANLSYAGLDTLPKDCNAAAVMARVIQLRNSKLPDPKKLPNAGSFFKNPIVSAKVFTALSKKYENMPCYQQTNGTVKLAAGWLIEQAGLKGFTHKQVGVHQKQALVIVNYGSPSGADIISLAKYIQRKVVDKFSVVLIPEVRMITAQGERDFDSITDNKPLIESDSVRKADND
jgi:UDP-N-acetylmuramate dehydrogenase